MRNRTANRPATSTPNRGKLSRTNRMVPCRVCKKLTHSDIQGAAGIELCGPCFDAAGLENEHADGYHESEAHPDCPDCAAAARVTPV